MTLSPIAVERDGPLTIVQLDDAANANALTMAMKDALLVPVADYFRDPAQRCLILTGTGRFFCAGAISRPCARDRTRPRRESVWRAPMRWCGCS